MKGSGVGRIGWNQLGCPRLRRRGAVAARRIAACLAILAGFVVLAVEVGNRCSANAALQRTTDAGARMTARDLVSAPHPELSRDDDSCPRSLKNSNSDKLNGREVRTPPADANRTPAADGLRSRLGAEVADTGNGTSERMRTLI